MKRRTFVLSAGTLPAVAVAGCLGDDDADDSDAEAGTPTPEESDEDDEGGKEPDHDIDEEFVDATGQDVVTVETRRGEGDEPDFVFDPDFVTVDIGTTIEWVNADGVFHTVTSTDSLDSRQGGGDVFDETISNEGDTFEWDADDPGIQPYYCSPHAGFMYGAIEIIE